MDLTASSAYGWALHELGFSEFNDERLTIRMCTFLLHPSKHRRRKEPPLSLYLLDVLEENPPVGEKGIHWSLTTTIPVRTAEEAIEKVVWYMYRWRIERFHFILKTGAFNVEKLAICNISPL